MSLEKYSHKKVLFRFNRKSLEFYLSQQLFSSFDIDPGSKLLLKHCIEIIRSKTVKNILDIGCGCGVLGLSLMSSLPEAECTLQDRDAFAVAFSRLNSRLNGLEQRCKFRAAPAFTGKPDTFDLVVSNIPAKAGNSVIRSWIMELPGLLTENGFAALVIVKPLEEFLRSSLLMAGFSIISDFTNSSYGVFICSAASAENGASSVNSEMIEKNRTLPHFYSRQKQTFSWKKHKYKLDCSWNITDFDKLGYDIVCAFHCLDKMQQVKNSLCLYSGQGHIPVYMAQSGLVSTTILLADNDTLALETSASNCASHIEIEKAVIETPENMDFIKSSFDLICIRLADTVSKSMFASFFTMIEKYMHSSSWLLLYGKSSRISAFSDTVFNMTIKVQHKNRGFRSILYKKML